MRKLFTALLLLCSVAMLRAQAPTAIMPIPTPAQLEWQKMETYAFIHFGTNTFTDKEWGYGDAAPSTFNPTRLDCDQWARVLKEAGMKAIIITAKHHDGFCLWQTKYTDYSVANSPWRDGKGDVVKELAEACKRHGLKMGVYLSPWDRHQATYATPAYVDYYHKQMKELLTQYGDIFEVWLDGANGGDGWYGGASEKRSIDASTYYRFPELHKLVYSYFPNAIIFSDYGPGCRWVGNEQGFAGQTNWSMMPSDGNRSIARSTEELNTGNENGTMWHPAECDVSIRPGWFWHESENSKVRDARNLLELYYSSVGRNANLLLNVPVNNEGLISDADIKSLKEFRALLDRQFAVNLMKKAKAEASSNRGGKFKAQKAVDGKYDTYWCPASEDKAPALTINMKKATDVNCIQLQEYIALGQRVAEFKIEYFDGSRWQPVSTKEQTTTIGYKRLVRFDKVNTRQLRVTIIKSRACPCLNNVEAFLVD